MIPFSKLLFLLCFPCLPWFIQLATAEEKPNVILILIDDQGYYDLGCYGIDIKADPDLT